jgi:ribA/ribD-fused uncharacterized protein
MPVEVHDLDSLREAVRSSKRVKFLFFWGHARSNAGLVGKECLSQWYPSRFEVGGLSFPTAEHFMMYRKALLFGDRGMAEQVLRAPNPGAAKALGRSVRGFREATWLAHRTAIVVEGNLAKFSQAPDLRAYLMNTKERVLVEASPLDRVWGIGLAADHEHAENPLLWRGLNLLGFALMAVRRRLA